MDKEEYLRQLYFINYTIKEIKDEFKNRWPEIPPLDSPEHEEWYRYILTLQHNFPELEFGFLYAGERGDDLFGRKPIWIDPSLRYPKGYDEFEGEERKELLVKHRQAFGRLLFDSVKIVIPIYPDTSREDIDQIWPRIEKFKKIAYGKIPAPKRGKWEENIRIYKFGQLKEEIENRTGKQHASWNNLADQLGITPQACTERYRSIKSFVNLHNAPNSSQLDTDDSQDIDDLELICETCEENKDCRLFKTGKTGQGGCVIMERIMPGEISPENYISVETVENKDARTSGFWEPEDKLIDNLPDDSD